MSGVYSVVCYDDDDLQIGKGNVTPVPAERPNVEGIKWRCRAKESKKRKGIMRP